MFFTTRGWWKKKKSRRNLLWSFRSWFFKSHSYVSYFMFKYNRYLTNTNKIEGERRKKLLHQTTNERTYLLIHRYNITLWIKLRNEIKKLYANRKEINERNKWDCFCEQIIEKQQWQQWNFERELNSFFVFFFSSEFFPKSND